MPLEKESLKKTLEVAMKQQLEGQYDKAEAAYQEILEGIPGSLMLYICWVWCAWSRSETAKL